MGAVHAGDMPVVAQAIANGADPFALLRRMFRGNMEVRAEDVAILCKSISTVITDEAVSYRTNAVFLMAIEDAALMTSAYDPSQAGWRREEDNKWKKVFEILSRRLAKEWEGRKSLAEMRGTLGCEFLKRHGDNGETAGRISLGSDEVFPLIKVIDLILREKISGENQAKINAAWKHPVTDRAWRNYGLWENRLPEPAPSETAKTLRHRLAAVFGKH